MGRGRCHIGTSGWAYRHWTNGRFYPPGLRSGDWLPFLAQHYDTVEINSSFYRLPRAAVVARWRDAVPGAFRFAVKLWRQITHFKRLANCAAELERFFSAANELGRKRGPLLVQLPPHFRPNPERLDDFLAAFKLAAGALRWRVAVEVRHPDWLRSEVMDVLNRRRAALCLADLPRCPVPEPNDAAFIYIRRHGPQGGYEGRYTPEQIAADARRIQEWLDAGKDVYMYYNNDIGGHAVDNARQLREALG